MVGRSQYIGKRKETGMPAVLHGGLGGGAKKESSGISEEYR